jgi:hypothetical protein
VSSRTFPAGRGSWRACSGRWSRSRRGELRARSDSATLYPYRSPARPGDRLPVELRITNHGARGAVAGASLVAPPGWSVSPGGRQGGHRGRMEGAARSGSRSRYRQGQPAGTSPAPTSPSGSSACRRGLTGRAPSRHSHPASASPLPGERQAGSTGSGRAQPGRPPPSPPSGCRRARNARMIPVRGSWRPGPPERDEARRTPVETPEEPWRTSSAISSRPSVSEG